MRARAFGAVRRRHPAHPSGERRDGKSQRLQRCGEQAVQLEAIAATAFADELLLQRSEIEPNGPPKEWVEAFEGDRGRLQSVDRLKRRKGRGPRSGVADPGEVGVEIEGLDTFRILPGQ